MQSQELALALGADSVCVAVSEKKAVGKESVADGVESNPVAVSIEVPSEGPGPESQQAFVSATQ